MLALNPASYSMLQRQKHTSDWEHTISHAGFAGLCKVLLVPQHAVQAWQSGTGAAAPRVLAWQAGALASCLQATANKVSMPLCLAQLPQLQHWHGPCQAYHRHMALAIGM
jgi:hypothetical protein